MKAIILAGGKGTRLYPVTLEIPKPLLPVQKKPVLNHLVELFLNYDICDFALLIRSDQMEEYSRWIGKYNFPANFEIFSEENPLGTFGSVAQAKDWIDNEPFFVTNGDELKDLDLDEMIDLHKTFNAEATIGLVKVDQPHQYGVAVCEDVNIVDFLEKPENPPSSYINSGLYIFQPQIFNYYPHKDLKFSMIEKDLFPRLARERKLYGYRFNGQWFDCGNFERWEKAMKEWKGITVRKIYADKAF